MGYFFVQDGDFAESRRVPSIETRHIEAPDNLLAVAGMGVEAPDNFFAVAQKFPQAPPRGLACLLGIAPASSILPSSRAIEKCRSYITAAFFYSAGWENRTPNHSLENCYFTIKLIPLKLRLSYQARPNFATREQ